MVKKKLWWILLAISLADPTCLNAEQVTVDALMRLRSISDVRISPDGKQIAYVVSTPSFETAAHEAVLYRIPVAGGTPLRLTYRTRILNKPLPSPWLRWSPDGSLLSFIAYVDETPQVLAISSAGGEPWPLTAVKGGVVRYEWSPNSKEIAFVASDTPPAEEERRKKEKSYVIGVDRDRRLPRLWLQEIPGGIPKAITSADKTVLDFSWAPDGKGLVYSASDQPGFSASYNSAVYTISREGGEPRAIVRRPGTNRMAQYSPDARFISFISSGGHTGMMNGQDLYIVVADGSRPPSGLTQSREVWVNEYIWAPDKAASTAASISDLINLYYLSDAGDVVVEYFGFPWEDTASLIQHSPITHVRNVSTPILIQHGEDDRRVPLSQAQQFYKALKTLHKIVEFDIYPRGGHINFEPPLEREYMLRNLKWFQQWLKVDSR